MLAAPPKRSTPTFRQNAIHGIDLRRYLPLIYFTEKHRRWAGAVADALNNARESVCISPLVKCECLVGPLKRGDSIQLQTYTELFGRLVTLDMPEPVYLQAAELRARFGLKIPDALHLACAQYHRCDALWTNDGRLTETSHGLARNILAGDQ